MPVEQQSEARLQPITDPLELLRFLRAGDHLALCFGDGWRLVQADAEVSERAVNVLRGGGIWLGINNEPVDFGGGRLAPLGDGLPGFGRAQTWTWAEGRSQARH